MVKLSNTIEKVIKKNEKYYMVLRQRILEESGIDLLEDYYYSLQYGLELDEVVCG